MSCTSSSIPGFSCVIPSIPGIKINRSSASTIMRLLFLRCGWDYGCLLKQSGKKLRVEPMAEIIPGERPWAIRQDIATLPILWSAIPIPLQILRKGFHLMGVMIWLAMPGSGAFSCILPNSPPRKSFAGDPGSIIW